MTGTLGDACDRAKVRVHRGGTYICMEGPQFSTLAEAHVHRQLRFEVIGMTNVTEAKLAREAEICYATVAMITDYDCWHPEHASVTLEEIISNLNKNAENAQNVLREAVRAMPAERACKCGSALAYAIITDPATISAAARKRLSVIAGKYLTQGSSLIMSLLVVGSVAFDAVETPHGKVDRMLGGAATYFAVAASFFTHVNLVGIVGTDFTEKDASIFKGRKIDTLGLERADGKTFFWAGKYSENMNERTTLATDLNVFADFKPKLPERLPFVAKYFSGEYPPGIAEFGAASGHEASEDRRARYDELLD